MEAHCFHICTREDHPIVFRNGADFRSGINILALCLCLFPDVKLYSFELMSNHFHLLVAGERAVIERFVSYYIRQLEHYFRCEGYDVDLSDLRPVCHPVDSQEYFRNVLVYIHRNGSSASADCTPFSYQWGTGRFYFNPEAVARYNACRQPLSLRQRQQFSHSRRYDKICNMLYTVDNYISPMCFCDIHEGESMFNSQRQYMYLLTRNIESSRDIAREIGETIALSDYELYSVVAKMSKEKFGESSGVLSPEQRMEIAKKLRYDYNAGNKQICRILKLSPSVVNMMFPVSGKKP